MRRGGGKPHGYDSLKVNLTKIINSIKRKPRNYLIKNIQFSTRLLGMTNE